MRRARHAALALAAVAATVAVGAWLKEPSAGRAPCWFEVPGHAAAECRYVAVPAFRGGDSDAEVLLAVAAISSGARAPGSGNPVLLIGGGPGGGMFGSAWPEHDYMPGWFEHLQPLLRDRDAILFDQRGVGLSIPNMNCPEIDRLASEAVAPIAANAEEGWALELEALHACADRLKAEGVDPAMLSTPTTARDIVAILDELGHDKADIWAFSYGARVALALLRDHGDRIGRVLLDGVFAPDADIDDLPMLTARAAGRLFQACRDAPACDAAFPGLEERFEAAIKRLNERPREMSLWTERWLTGPHGQPNASAPVDGDALVRGLFNMLYYTSEIPWLPLLFWFSLEESIDGFTVLLESTHYGDWGLDEGVYDAVYCREEFPFVDWERLERETAAHGIYGRPWLHLDDFAWCEMWPVAPAGAGERLPVASDHTVLLVSGWFDPVTPDIYAEAVAAHLPNSRHVVFRGAGHTPTWSEPCGAAFAARFFTGERPLEIEPRDCPAWSAPKFELEWTE